MLTANHRIELEPRAISQSVGCSFCCYPADPLVWKLLDYFRPFAGRGLTGGGGFGQATEVLGEELLGEERHRPNKDRSRAPAHPRALGTDRR